MRRQPFSTTAYRSNFNNCPGRTIAQPGTFTFLGFQNGAGLRSDKKMQAIDIRCEFAKLKILQFVYGNEVDCQIDHLIESATLHGETDFLKETYAVPPMFKDEPILVSAWQDGQKLAGRYSGVPVRLARRPHRAHWRRLCVYPSAAGQKAFCDGGVRPHCGGD